jgi:hypothetical protein
MLDKPEPPTLDQMIEGYVRTRDALKASDARHKEKTATARQWLKDQNTLILGQLQAIGVDNVKSPHGTAYRTTEKSATVGDAAAFWEFVVEHLDDGSRDLIDVRANAPAVSKFIKTHKTPPPGVNYTETEVAGVRRASET